MPDEPNPSGATSQPNGAAHAEPAPVERQPSLREIAEAAYDEVTAPEEGAGEQPPAGQEGTQPRDERGRFASKEATGEQPPETATQPQQSEGQKPPETTTQPAPAASSGPPANWPAADQELFRKQTPEAQAFLLRRHSEMEGDYQRRVQATRGAAEFVNAVAPVFTDPDIARSLQQFNQTPLDAVVQWGGFHKRAMSPNVGDRVQLLFELAARMDIDPAVFATGRPGPQGQQPPPLSEADLKDPAIKYFADHVGRTSSEVQQLRQQLQGMQRASAEAAKAEVQKATRRSIDSFADEVGADGKKLRPDFDQLIDTIVELFNANPDRDIREAYETARWMNPTSRQQLIDAEKAKVTQAEGNRRAAQAVRSNVRGLTSPVTKPADNGKPKSLRETIEESADSIGF